MHDGTPTRAELTSALLKVLALALVIGLGLGFGMYAVIRASGLGESSSPVIATGSSTAKPLPTTAITPTPSQRPSASRSPTAAPPPKNRIQLVATPKRVGPGQRINLTGNFPGSDGAVLAVQRREAGRWVPFAGISTTVRGGAFATYILTTRTGQQAFRVALVGGRLTSNPVRVQVG